MEVRKGFWWLAVYFPWKSPTISCWIILIPIPNSQLGNLDLVWVSWFTSVALLCRIGIQRTNTHKICFCQQDSLILYSLGHFGLLLSPNQDIILARRNFSIFCSIYQYTKSNIIIDFQSFLKMFIAVFVIK